MSADGCANHGQGACPVCGRKDVLLYSRDGETTIRLTYHDGPDGLRCEGGGVPPDCCGEWLTGSGEHGDDCPEATP